MLAQSCSDFELLIIDDGSTDDSKKIIEWLLEQGVKFTKNNSGSSEKLHLTKEGGHTHPRIVHAADKTGEAIQESLIDKLKKKIKAIVNKNSGNHFSVFNNLTALLISFPSFTHG